MNPRVQIIAVVATVIFAVMILELVRKRKLREEYSLLWLISIGAVGSIAFNRSLVTRISDILGIAYAPSAIFTIALAAMFLLVLHFSIVISRLVECKNRLTQEIGLLKLRLDNIEQTSIESESIGNVSNITKNRN